MKFVKHTLVALFSAIACSQALGYPIKVTKLENEEGVIIYNIYDLHTPIERYNKENLRALQHMAEEKDFTIFCEQPHLALIDTICSKVINVQMLLLNVGSLSCKNILSSDPRGLFLDQLTFLEKVLLQQSVGRLSEKTLKGIYKPLKFLWEGYSAYKGTTEFIKKSYAEILNQMKNPSNGVINYLEKNGSEWFSQNRALPGVDLLKQTMQFFDLQILLLLDNALQKGKKKFIIYSGAAHADNIENALTKNGFTATIMGQCHKSMAEIGEQIAPSTTDFVKRLIDKATPSDNLNKTTDNGLQKWLKTGNNLQKLRDLQELLKLDEDDLRKQSVPALEKFIDLNKWLATDQDLRKWLDIEIEKVYLENTRPTEENLQSIPDFKLTDEEIKKYKLRELPEKIMRTTGNICVTTLALACTTGCIIKTCFPSLWRWGRDKLTQQRNTEKEKLIKKTI